MAARCSPRGERGVRVARLQGCLSFAGIRVSKAFTAGVSGEAFRPCYRGDENGTHIFPLFNTIRATPEAFGFSYQYTFEAY